MSFHCDRKAAGLCEAQPIGWKKCQKMKNQGLNFEHNPFVRTSCKRSFNLEDSFHLFNSEYFQSKLRPYRVYLCSKPKFFAHRSAGYCSPSQRKIFIRNGLSKRGTLQTLVHEMVHSKLSWIRKETHWKMFTRELKRLRKLEAPLSPAEVDRVRGDKLPDLNPRNVRKAVFDALIIESLPKKFVGRYLELEFFLPYSEIRKITNVGKIVDDVLA